MGGEMSRFKSFGLRLTMGAVVASSLTVGTLALGTGTASAAPRHDPSFTIDPHNAVNKHSHLPAISIEEARLFRIAIMEGNGRCMLADDCPLHARYTIDPIHPLVQR